MRMSVLSAAVRVASVSGPGYTVPGMDWKIELVAIQVTDVDRAKAFYVDQVGFHADHDHQVNEALRFVQLTPPGSACSVVMGTGITEMAPGSQKGVQVVVADVEAARSSSSRMASRPAMLMYSRGAPSSPSATPMEIPGRCSSCLRGGRSLVSPQRRQYHTPETLPQIPGHGRSWQRQIRAFGGRQAAHIYASFLGWSLARLAWRRGP